ncbi:MAG: phosphate/phosphite/phosphonate ABC transporter substrate-binding protein [Burkholderiales bacterium]|nr:phosphate/phosphite/phosphonate ABC transporter substrate-binding protein [Burkholderiales bacterium]
MQGKLSLFIGVLCALATGVVRADEPSYGFSVLNQRSPILSAQYWNPILAYVHKKSGVELRLKMGKTAPETTALTIKGEAQFAYTNHLFTIERVKLGWRVIARPTTDGIRGQIVVPADSAISRLEDLDRQSVAFPSAEAYAGYRVPMDVLLRKGIKVSPLFAGNQEGAMGQMKSGRVVAAGVNEDVMAAFSKREKFAYRSIWSSEEFKDLPIMVSPSVPESDARAVQQALVGMLADPEGKKILEQGAQLLKFEHAVGFMTASDKDYDNYREFYRKTVLKD